MENLIITPRTKIFDLLEAYPQLEDTLISTAPQFKKLKNPVLRRTIAKVTNLGQAAVIGGIKTEELINILRKEIGQSAIQDVVNEHAKYNTSKPSWFDIKHITNTIDIRNMLDAGEQPVHEVLSAIKLLKKNEILKVYAPFLPAPLIDKSESLNYHYWLDKKGEEEFLVYFKNNVE